MVVDGDRAIDTGSSLCCCTRHNLHPSIIARGGLCAPERRVNGSSNTLVSLEPRMSHLLEPLPLKFTGFGLGEVW